MGSRTISMIYSKSSTVPDSWLQCLLMSLRSPRSSMRDLIQILVKKEELAWKVSTNIHQCGTRGVEARHSVICMIHWLSPRLSSINRSKKVWIGSLRRCKLGISLFLPCIEIWTKRNETWPWGSFSLVLEKYLLPLICWPEAMNYGIPPTGQTAFTELVMVVSLTIRVWLLTLWQQKTRRLLNTLRFSTTFPLKRCLPPHSSVVDSFEGLSCYMALARTAGMGRKGNSK